MQVTVTTLTTGKVFSLDIPEDLELENFKAFCEAESNIPASDIVIIFNGAPLTDNKKPIKDYGVKNHDMVVLERNKPTVSRPTPNAPSSGPIPMLDFSKIKIPTALTQGGGGGSTGEGPSGLRPPPNEEDPAVIRDMLKAHPDQMAQLKQNNPRLAEALESDNLEEFAKVLKEQQEARAERERLRLRMLTADPMDMEAQRLIAQEIENKNIETNMELAMEYNPESFGTVVMLYIDCKVNGHNIKAFVDSGAQATIMSQKAAERCNIMRLVDRRWAGIAKGVGTQKIIGRVHVAQIQIGNDFLSSSFSILEEQPMDMLLGLDMLKRHQCSIDLKNNVLAIGSTGAQYPFLAETDLPECARLSSRGKDGGQEDVDEVMKASAKEHEETQLKEAMRKSEDESKRLKSNHNSPASTSTGTDSGAASTANDPNVILPNDRFTEDNVKALMGYGFSREVCIQELRAQNGDERAATAALFARSLKM